jgi:hypothetical protein
VQYHASSTQHSNQPHFCLLGHRVAPNSHRRNARSGHQANHRHRVARPPRLRQDVSRARCCSAGTACRLLFSVRARNCNSTTCLRSSITVRVLYFIFYCNFSLISGTRCSWRQRKGTCCRFPSSATSMSLLRLKPRQFILKPALLRPASCSSTKVLPASRPKQTRDVLTAQAIFAGRQDRGRAGQQLSAQ